MKRIKLNTLAFSFLAMIALNSCEKDQDYSVTGNLPVGTITSDKSVITESDDDLTTTDVENVATYSFTMDKAYKTDMKFKLELISEESTGSAEDFEITLGESGIDNGTDGYLIKVPANETTVNFSIKGLLDTDIAASENLKFKITPVADMNGVVASNSQTFNLTINNSVSDNLDIIFDWEVAKEYKDVNGANHSYEDFDFDLEIYYNGSPVLSSYSSAPEAVEFLSAYPDGTFIVTASFWDASTAAEPMLPISFKPTLTVAKKGVFVKDFDLSGKWNSSIGGSEQGNANAYVDVCYFVKTGSTYQLYDMTDNLLASGKISNVKNTLKNLKKSFPVLDKRVK